jgi:hypothetical protein
VQAVSKAYVDQTITELTQSLLTASGGTLSGPLYLNGDPSQALQAADKHYVDSAFGLAVPLAGGSMTGALATPAVNGVQAPATGSTQTTIQAAVSAAGTSGAVEIPPTYAGSDGFTNPNGVYVTDLRQKGAQQYERSVKEFGAVCDGTTDDTNALQAALNYAQTHGVALTIPQGTCKTHVLSWRGESIGGMGKQVSALKGFPGQDVLATATDSTNLLAHTRLHDLTIYVDQSLDVSCSAAEGRAPAGSCAMSRLLESNSIFSPGGNGLTGTAGTGTAWAVGNCAIAMPAATGAGGNGLRVAEIENLEIAATGTDPMAQYTGAHSTHTCGMYLAQWPQWSEFRNIDIRGLNTGIAVPALPGTTPTGLNADSNRWQNITIQATHGFTAAAGSNNVLDNVVAAAANSAATGEPPTGLVLDLSGTQQGWTVRNAVVLPAWNVVTPALTVTAAGGAVTAVTAGTEKGLGFDPYGTTVPLKFSGSCTAAATANVKSDGSIGTIGVTQGGVGCSGTTTASVNVDGTWDTAAPVNLIAGQNMTLFGGNLQKGNGGYTVWNAADSRSSGTMVGGGGGTLPGGGSYAGLVGSSSLGSATQVEQFPGRDFGAKLQACLGAVSATYGGTCDARNFTGNLSMASNLTVSAANVTVLLPCATISTAAQVIVTAGTRNVALRGCALRGASTASGSQGGTVFLYSGTGAMVQVGDPTYAADTMGFHLDNVVINTTASSSATAQGLTAYRTQEMDLESLYFLGNQNQTGMTLDGTGNYTGGTFFDDAFNGFQTAVNAIGHQVSNAATTDWMNASAFVRLHIDCPTSAGNPISGTYGINLQQGDGNTFTGGDVESCSTALHLGVNAQNNTIIGLRNENSTNQVVADAGSSYNNWMTGGTMFTGQLTDNGTRNSFMDTFHRSFNGIKGDWYGSQQDATVTNHYRIGIGAGNERGLLNRYQTDYGYRWTTGLSDATAGEQFFQVLDELNNVNRLSIGQYNNGQSSTNNQTAINAAGTGAIVLNGSNNSGTGGVIIGSGGASAGAVATINNSGNAQFNGTLQVGGASTFTGSTTVKNQADAEIDQFLWAGTTASQKESYTYKDWNGSSQWYMVKDANNNWALNSATGGLDSFKAYQSGNSGDTYINTSNSSGVVRLNYESGSSGKTYIYGGTSGSLIAAFSGTTAIAFPGLAASSGHNCLQIDNSGYISNTGSACGTGSGGTNGTVSSGNAGQIAYYAANGTAVSGTSAVPVTAGGTGAVTAAGALSALGAQPAIPGLAADGQTSPGIQVTGTVAAPVVLAKMTPEIDVDAYISTSDGHNGADYGYAINAAVASVPNNTRATIKLSGGVHHIWTPVLIGKSVFLNANGASLVPQSGGANGVWGAAPVTVNGCRLTGGSTVATCPSTAGLTAGMAVGGTGVPVADYINCVGTWSGSTCVASATQITLALPAKLDFTASDVVGSTTLSGIPYMTGLTVGLSIAGLNSSQGIPSGATITALHYGGASPLDTQSITISAPATATLGAAYITVTGSWSTNLVAETYVPVVTWENTSACVRNTEGQCQHAGEERLTIQDPGFRSLTGVSGEQIIGLDEFDSTDLRVFYIAGSALILGGQNPGPVPAGHETVRESSFRGIKTWSVGEHFTGQAAIVLMTGASGCPNACDTADEINQIGFDSAMVSYPASAGLVVGTYDTNHFNSVLGPRQWYFTDNSQFEGGAEPANNGRTNNIAAPDDMVIIYDAANYSFNQTEIAVAGYGRFLMRSYWDNGATVTGGSLLYDGSNAQTYTVQSVGGSSTLTYVSDANGVGSFDPSGLWNGVGAILTDTGSCSTGCNVYLAASGAVNGAGSTVTLAAPLYGSSSDSTATLIIGQPGFFALAAPNGGSALFWQNYYVDPSARGMGLYGLTSASGLWVGVYSRSNYDGTTSFNGIKVEVSQLQVGGSLTLPPTYGTNNITVTQPTVSGQLALTSQLPGSTITTINGQACTLGSSCTVTAIPSGTASTSLGGLGADNSSSTGVPVFSNGTSAVMPQVGISGGSPVKATNAYGCLDGYDHLPCVVYNGPVITESSTTSTTAIYTTTAAGYYRINGGIYATAPSSTTYVVYQVASTLPTGISGTFYPILGEANIGTSGSLSAVFPTSYMANLPSGAVISAGSQAASGTNTGGSWARFVSIERVK